MTEINKVSIGNAGQTYKSKSGSAQTQQISLGSNSDTVTLPDKTQKKVVPAILSFFIPGSGQVMNDEPRKGVKHFLTAAVAGVACAVAATKAWAMRATNSSFLFDKGSEAVDKAFHAKAQASNEAFNQGFEAFKTNMANDGNWIQEAETVRKAAIKKAKKELPHSSGKIRALGIVTGIAGLASLAVHVFSAKDAYNGKQA